MYNECRHIFTSGKKCQSPALKDHDFCYFHQSNRRVPQVREANLGLQEQPSTVVHHLTPLEDADAIQLALSDVVLALAANRIDPRRAQILIYGLQVASQNHRHRAAQDAKEAEIGTQVQTVRETHEHADGTLIAPPKQTPDPEEIVQKERPSLGLLLLREAEAMRAEKEAQRQGPTKCRRSRAIRPAHRHLPARQCPRRCRRTGAPSSLLVPFEEKSLP